MECGTVGCFSPEKRAVRRVAYSEFGLDSAEGEEHERSTKLPLPARSGGQHAALRRLQQKAGSTSSSGKAVRRRLGIQSLH